MSELNSKVDDSNRNVNELQSQKSRLQQETADLTRQLEDAEHRVGTLTKEKTSLATQLEEAKRSLEDETRVSIGQAFKKTHLTSPQLPQFQVPFLCVAEMNFLQFSVDVTYITRSGSCQLTISRSRSRSFQGSSLLLLVGC